MFEQFAKFSSEMAYSIKISCLGRMNSWNTTMTQNLMNYLGESI